MLDFAIFAVTVVVTLIISIIYLYPGSKRVTTIPGPEVIDPLEGNLPDVASCGSLHEFLVDQHQEYGDIVHFWLGPQLTVSVATPELFKQSSAVFDRPAILYEIFQPLLSTSSVLYANGGDGRLRHAAYTKCFNEDAMKKLSSTIQEATDALLQKMSTIPADDHIPLREYMLAYAAKTLITASFGKNIKDEKEILKLKRSYDIVWADFVKQYSGDKLEEETQRMKLFTKECDSIKSTLKSILQNAIDGSGDKAEPGTFIKAALSLNTSKETKSADMATLLLSTIQTMGLLLTWSLYYLADNPDIQDKVLKEVKEVAGNKKLSPEMISKMTYLRQVIDETMRCAVIAPHTSRVQEFDSELGGHVVPKGTPVIQALGVSFQNPDLWPEPDKFNPDRFSPEKRKKLPSHAFGPFGFAGKRKCPGSYFSIVQTSIFLADLLRKFKVSLVEGQVVVPVYGLVTTPKEEIWITIAKRK